MIQPEACAHGPHLSGIPAVTRFTTEIKKQIRAFIGDNDVPESRPQFSPAWILEKAKQQEYKNYMDSVQIFSLSSLPRSANIVSFPHFFKVKFHGETGKLKLKCRIVPHGNKNQLKDEIRSESSIAQFPIIRMVLSMAALHKLKIAS